MKIVIHIDDNDIASLLQQAFSRINQKLDFIIDQNRRETRRDNLMAKTASELLAAVQAETTVIDSLGVFVQQLKDQLAAQGVDQAAIDAAFEGVTANSLKEAAFMNTAVPAPEETPAA